MKKLLLILAAIFGPFMVFGQLLTTYEYDELNRLVQVNYPNGQLVQFEYDVLGNRTGMTVTQLCAIQVVVNPEGSGTVNGMGIYEPQSPVTLTAQPNSGFVFTNWTENGEVVSTENPYEFVAYSNRNLIAVFEEDLYYHFIIPGNWSEASNWSNNMLPSTNAIVFIDAPCQLDTVVEVANLTITANQSLTLQAGKTLTVTDTLTNSAVSGLIIEDGAQLINNSANVAATVKKNVQAFGNDNPDGWYTIASPMNGMAIAGSNFLTPSYDLYRFNETNLTNEEWENYKANLADFTAFENGRGYLYANSSTFSPTFTGTLNNTEVTYSLTCTNRPDDSFSGFNLIGNPFPHEIYKGADGAIDNAYLASGYYTLTNEGTWEPHTYDEAIQPGQGILVKATAPINLTIAKSNEEAYAESGGAKTETALLRISVEGDDGRDRAFVYFGHGVGLDKVEDLGQNAPSLAIRNDQGDFAIAHFDKKSDVIELVFTTPNNGDATLNVKAVNSDFDSLHLIDPTTGADIDLLQQPSYTFSASGQAGERHFKLLYKQSEN